MSTAPSTNGTEKKTGLKIDRVFSDPQVHPFDQIEWARRDAEIKDEKGNYVFKQEGVEFPESWSQLAVNIVASKYFYGDATNGNGSPADEKREWSVKQLVRRVARTISKWGYADGYFALNDDAYVFECELTWLLVNQHGAFNSPVWFNVGLWDEYRVEGNTTAWRWDKEQQEVVPLQSGEAYKYPQASACFLQSLEDNMDSIMNLAKAEAMLFKSGSGTGTNLSALRSTREKLAGGGKPSGPVSFFRVYDAVASVVKSGGKTRRAARLNCLDCDHPDIIEFIECKGKEDKKARALIAAGYSSGMTGDFDEAYSSVSFQNTNISIRVTDEFMRKATGEDPDPSYWTKAVTDGRPIEKLNAKDVLRKIAEETWACGDPGLQYHDTINKWNTAANTHELVVSNPCGEYNYINDSACNLASLNLMKFVDADGSFDHQRFEAAVRIFIIAQEILVDNASYPTEKIARNSHDYRPLGLGFANLGCLLMTSGMPYDSFLGRSYAGAVTAIMQGAAARASAEIAGVMGSFNGFPVNYDPATKVMGMHRDAAFAGLEEIHASVDPRKDVLAKLWLRVTNVWDHAQLAVGRYGYRNGQLSVTAPTGTISFLMDCQTTGCEPDIALVKYKKLAGGGVLKIVNQAVPVALDWLGYDGAAINKIVAYVDANDTIEGAPGLKADHLAVFDCAFPSKEGGRCIHWQGHARMLAATQPFISGSQSKTLNLSKEATVQDIIDAYVLCWKLGVKSAAIYRDGSKGVQPLNTKKDNKEKAESKEAEVPKPRRERLPATRRSLTHKFEIAGHEGYINVGFYPDGRVGEIFCTISKEGSTISGLMDSLATTISIGLQYGVPLEVFVNKLSHVRFDPSGMTRNKKIPFAKSIPDYIARFLGSEFLDPAGTPEANGYNPDGEASPQPTAVEASDEQAQFAKFQADAPICETCGSITVRNGSCYRCHNCGASLGCS